MWDAGDTLDYDASNPYRSLRATYWLPSMDEWYKAAFYDPNTGTYFDDATGSKTAPMAVAGGTTAETAVYNGQAGPADIYLGGGLSPYGTMAQSGNVWEWEETAFDLVNNIPRGRRGRRGGSWLGYSNSLQSSDRDVINPSVGVGSVGFQSQASASSLSRHERCLGWLGSAASC